jgi:hypothetical protein
VGKEILHENWKGLNMAILLDFGGTIHASIFASMSSSGETRIDEMKVRNIILGHIRNLRKAFIETYGGEKKTFIIAVDSHGDYWRRKVFKNYKYTRKENRKISEYDWNSIFQSIDTIVEEFKEFLPYYTLRIRKAEADDVIAVLIKNHPWGNEENLIVSNDKDFCQLHKYNCRQYYPTNKKYIQKIENSEFYLKEHIIGGDVSDGIPNIRTPENFFYQKFNSINPNQKFRQKVCSDKFIRSVISGDRVLTDEEKERYELNKKVIDFDEIPTEISEIILEAFREYKLPKITNVMKYFMRDGMRQQLNHIQDYTK